MLVKIFYHLHFANIKNSAYRGLRTPKYAIGKKHRRCRIKIPEKICMQPWFGGNKNEKKKRICSPARNLRSPVHGRGTFLSVRIWQRPPSESRFDGTRCRIAGLQTLALRLARIKLGLKPVKCEFKMLPADVRGRIPALILCLARQLYSNLAEN